MSPKTGDSSPAPPIRPWPTAPANGSDGEAPGADSPLPQAVISVPDVRDYQRINAEIVQQLDQGLRHIRLLGVEGQRLLLAGVAGDWPALIEIEGSAGPELAAGLRAPRLRIVCLGPAADGAGSGLVDGRLLITGTAGACLGASQRGGCIAVVGPAAERAGLNQSGGTLVLLGRVGPLAGERQSGGVLYTSDDPGGGRPGRGRRGGRFVRLRDPLDDDSLQILDAALRPFQQWLASGVPGVWLGAEDEGRFR